MRDGHDCVVLSSVLAKVPILSCIPWVSNGVLSPVSVIALYQANRRKENPTYVKAGTPVYFAGIDYSGSITIQLHCWFCMAHCWLMQAAVMLLCSDSAQVSTLLNWSSESQNHFRMKARVVFERLIRKFG